MMILRKIFAVYGVLFFWTLLIIFTPFYWLGFKIFGRKADRPLLQFGYHFVAPWALIMFGVFRRNRERKVVSGKGPHIIVSNHRSFLDILINAASYPGVYKFLSKKELVKLPVYGIIIRQLCILVDRKDPESRARSYEEMKEELDAGFSILLYPEGTRNRSEEVLTAFYDGAFRLASETGYPLAVTTLWDPAKSADPRHGLNLWPGIITVKWGRIEDTKDQPIEELKQKARKMMLDQLGKSSL